MEIAQFITTEDGDDLIVSFAIPIDDEPGNVKSLTLLRTPKYEFMLDEHERGVSVSIDDSADEEDERLRRLKIEGDTVVITTDSRAYEVSIRDVDPTEVQDTKEVLEAMNFDGRFELELS